MTCAIILAAGRSERMGAPKLLLPFAGSTVIARVADAFLDAPVDLTIVVVRPGDERVRAALGSRPVKFVENTDPQSDMLGSVRCGLRALPAGTKAVLVSPGDQPSLEAGLVRQMLSFYRDKEPGILVPVHAGQRGHPLVFAGRFCQEILSSYDGVGLRGFVQAHAAEVLEGPSPDRVVLEDLDTPAEYQAARPPRAFDGA